MTRLRASLLRWARAGILEAVEQVEGHVGHMGEPMDSAAATAAREIRETVGTFTDALLLDEQGHAQKFGRLG